MKLFLFLALVFILTPFFAYAGTQRLSDELQVNLYRAKVIGVEEIIIMETTVQVLEIRILNRDFRGHEATIRNTVVDNVYAIRLETGDRISVHMELDSNGEAAFYFQNYDRTGSLMFLFVFFAACVVALGRVKGIKALAALSFTIILILFGLVPLLLRGYNPIILSVITCILSAVVTFCICFGFGKKSAAAIIGVSGGLLAGGIIAYFFGSFAKLTGIAHGDAQMLQYLPGGLVFDFKGMLFAGIIIGALGACLDVAISISSSLTEIKTLNPAVENKELIQSGFNIGKDIMGSMVNTLVLAYTGSSLATILIFVGFERGVVEIINLDSIATEIVRAIAGSLGLLFAIPITIFAFVLLHKSDKVVEDGRKE